jgi:hypothetical protein
MRMMRKSLRVLPPLQYFWRGGLGGGEAEALGTIRLGCRTGGGNGA